MTLVRTLLDDMQVENETSLNTRRTLLWTRLDHLVLGVYDFYELRDGISLLQEATHFEGKEWCQLLNEHIRIRISTACRVYIQSMKHTGSKT